MISESGVVGLECFVPFGDKVDSSTELSIDDTCMFWFYQARCQLQQSLRSLLGPEQDQWYQSGLQNPKEERIEEGERRCKTTT